MINSLKVLLQFPYNKKYPLKAISRFLEWKLIRLFKIKNYKKQIWSDKYIYLSFDSLQSMWLMYHYIVDWEEFNLIENYLKNNMVFFDVGSNMGFYTLWASRFLNISGSIHSFEPDENNFNRLYENLKINNIQKFVTINQVAISDINGILQFSIGLDGENHILSNANDAFTKVDSLSLDFYCKSNNVNCIDYLKVDVEGFELMVIKGAKNLIEQKRIKIIQLEINKTLGNSNTSSEELINTLEEFGYILCKYDVEKKQLKPIRYSINRENYFFVFDINILAF